MILIFNDHLLQMPWESMSSQEREKFFWVSAITWMGEIFATFYADAEALKFWFWLGLDKGNKLFLSLFGLLPLKCSILEILLIDDCQEISRESYKISPFKQHNNLQLSCVAHNPEALFPDYVIEMLKYANRKVIIDIRGRHFTEEDFNLITREHCDALERIKDVEDYQHLVCFP